MDSELNKYWIEIKQSTGLEFPTFAKGSVHTAPILAVLQTPGNSGAEASKVCSIENNDPTARRLKRILEEVQLRPEQIILWNFYAAFEKSDKSKRDRKSWAQDLERLLKMMPNLKAVIVFGDEAWRGIRDVDLRKGVGLVGTRHPSARGCLPDTKEAEKEIKRAWERAKALL